MGRTIHIVLDADVMEDVTVRVTQKEAQVTQGGAEVKEKAKAPQVKIPYKEIMDYLNDRGARDFSWNTPAWRIMIRARWSAHPNIETFKTVIDDRRKEWLGTEWFKYMAPGTIFQEKKFESYLEHARTAAREQRRPPDEKVENILKKTVARLESEYAEQRAEDLLQGGDDA